jgi:MFS family permease
VKNSDRSRSGIILILLAYIGFVSPGLPDAVIGVAWPSVRDTFRLPQGAAGLVFVASGLGYFVASFLSGRLTHAMGIGLLLAASTALVAAAMLEFAFSPAWPLFVSCAVVHGFGSGAIDAGLNGYAAHYLSARHMNWLHACYCFGAMLGPLLMTAVLTSGRLFQEGIRGRRFIFLRSRPASGPHMPLPVLVQCRELRKSVDAGELSDEERQERQMKKFRELQHEHCADLKRVPVFPSATFPRWGVRRCLASGHGRHSNR